MTSCGLVNQERNRKDVTTEVCLLCTGNRGKGETLFQFQNRLSGTQQNSSDTIKAIPGLEQSVTLPAGRKVLIWRKGRVAAVASSRFSLRISQFWPPLNCSHPFHSRLGQSRGQLTFTGYRRHGAHRSAYTLCKTLCRPLINCS